MLKNTFCHIPGVGLQTERRLWEMRIHSWDDLPGAHGQLSVRCYEKLARGIDESFRQLEDRNVQFFATGMPSGLHWRLFPDFSGSVAYLDIETTGLYEGSSITTIALYDGRVVHHFVQGHNLRDFTASLKGYDVLVTYNGKCFDIPFIERIFRISLRDKAHIDLRYVLGSLGYTGGLKECERRLGLARRGLEDVDGFLAVLLWNEYRERHDEKALETLLAYNVQDVLALEKLMILAYNEKLRDTPFERSHRLATPAGVQNPFRPDEQTIRRIRGRFYVAW